MKREDTAKKVAYVLALVRQQRWKFFYHDIEGTIFSSVCGIRVEFGRDWRCMKYFRANERLFYFLSAACVVEPALQAVFVLRYLSLFLDRQ